MKFIDDFIKSIFILCCFFAIISCGHSLQLSRPGTIPPKQQYQLPETLPDQTELMNLLASLDHDQEDPMQCRKVGTYYQMLSRNNLAYADKAIELLERACTAMEHDPQTNMFLGLSYVEKALGSDLPTLEKLALARRGFQKVDHAINIDSENLSFRVLRGHASIRVLKLMGQRPTLKEDEIWIRLTLKSLKSPKHLAILGYEFLAEYQEKIQKDHDQSIFYWTKAEDLKRGNN